MMQPPMQKPVCVSILMPMRNAEPFVHEALMSLLCETSVSLEVIVVDDGSIDGSRKIVEAVGDTRVRVLDGPQRGIAACLNVGVSAARGELLMRCDADDLFPSDRIRGQFEWMQKHPGHAAVCCGFATMDRSGRPVAELGVARGAQAVDIEEELKKGVVRTSLCTFAWRRSLLTSSEMFREFFETSEDLDFQLRLAEAGPVGYVPVNGYFYRLHGTSVTHTQKNIRRVFFEETAKRFQEQRRLTGADDLMLGRPPTPPEAEDRASSVDAHLQGMLMGQAWRDLDAGNSRTAVSKAWRAVLAQPRQLQAWRGAAILFVKALTSRRPSIRQ